MMARGGRNMLWDKEVNVSINIIVAIAGICLIDLCYIFVIHTQQDATQRNKIHETLWVYHGT
jgi:hypothetical protein